MNYPKTVKELKEQNWDKTAMKMMSPIRGVPYSAYISPDNKYVACVDSSDGDVTMIFTRDGFSVVYVHPTTQKGWDFLKKKWKVKK